MPLNLILEDWSDYDNRKIRDKRESEFFSCDESWEKEYRKHPTNHMCALKFKIKHAIKMMVAGPP